MASLVPQSRSEQGRRLSLAGQLIHLVSHGWVHIAVVAIALIWLVPSLGLFVTSFRARPDIASSGWWNALLSLQFTTANYVDVLAKQGMFRSLANSFLITIPSTLLPLIVASLAAYGFTWLRFRGREWLFLAVVAMMMFPIQMALVPVLRMFRVFSLTQSLLGIWLIHTAFGLPFAVFLLRNFFISLPEELIEAARIDGASHGRILTRLILPLSVPALASLTIFQFLWVWNDLMMSLIFIQNPDFLPLTVHISKLLSTYGTEWHVLSAGAFILMSVPLVIFFSLQRYFVQGLLSGSVK